MVWYTYEVGGRVRGVNKTGVLTIHKVAKVVVGKLLEYGYCGEGQCVQRRYFLNVTATTEIYTILFVGSVRCA